MSTTSANLKQAVQSQMVTAMKAGDKVRTQVLRMMLSEIKAVEVDHPSADPQAAVASYAKKLKKALAEFEKLSANEQVAQLKGEISIVDEFLPRQMGDAELEAIVNKTIASTGAASAKDSGKVIGAVMKQTGGVADAGRVRALVTAKLPA
jgi:uncharacterized protein YqeY